MEQPIVSIICNAYKHEAYIRDALDSFLMQKTNFPFEILVHDDASPDKTPDIIREYEEKFPGIVLPIYQTENQYSKKGRIMLRIQVPRVRGKYIALCEGDDYWTDENKLQKQVDALEAHPEADICATGAYEVKATDGTVVTYTAPFKKDTVISVEDVIAGGGGFVATCSLLLRSNILKEPDREVFNFTYDYPVQISGSLRGGMVYLADLTCAHKCLTENSWSMMMRADNKKRESHSSQVEKILMMFDEDTGGKYSAIIKHKIDLYQIDNKYMSGEYREIKQAPLKDVYKTLPASFKFKINLHIYAPFLFTAKNKLMNRTK